MNHSVQQHNLEWLYYDLIAEWCGYETYEVYEICVRLFLRVVNPLGEVVYKRPTSLTATRHSDYLENIKRFFAEEFEFILPDPDIDQVSPTIEDYKVIDHERKQG